MKKLLVTGASGFLGYNLCQYAQENWQVYGSYYNHKLDSKNINFVKVDVTNIDELQTIFLNYALMSISLVFSPQLI